MEQVIEILKLAWYGHEIEGLIKLEPISAGIAIGSAAASLVGSLLALAVLIKKPKERQEKKED